MSDISKIQLPDNSEYDLKDTTARAKGSIYYGTCATAAGTKDKVATVSAAQNFVLQVGSMVAVKFSNTNSYSATSSNHITLNVNSTGAFDIWYGATNATTGTTTAAFGTANYYGYYMYDGTYWVFAGRSLDGDSGNSNLRLNGNILAGTDAIVKYNIICADSSNKYYHLKKGTAFDIRWPILYANADIAANGTGTNNYVMVNVAIATTQSLTLTAYKPLYIKGTLSGTTFTPISTAPITQTVPTAEDGYYYLYLGVAISTTNFYLLDYHPIYVYVSGSFKIYDQSFAVNKNLQGVDLNTVKETGFYYAGGNNGCSNMPSNYTQATGFGLIVEKTAKGNYLIQIYCATSSSQYIRTCYNGVWGDWLDYNTRVFQSSTTTTNWRKVLLSYQDGESEDAVTENRQQVFANQYIEAQPSTGTLKANNLLVDTINNNDINEIIEKVSDDIITVEGNPLILKTYSEQIAKHTELDISPIQDLNGYDYAWSGGQNKNMFQTSSSGINTYSGATYIINQDNGSIRVYGTYSGSAFSGRPVGSIALPAGTYIFNGQNGVDSTNKKLTLQLYDTASQSQICNLDTAADYTFTLTETKTLEVRIGLRVGFSIETSKSVVITPMIRLSSEEDPTFVPYANICSISGLTDAVVEKLGKNVLEIADGFNNTTIHGTTVSTANNGEITIDGTEDSSPAILIWNFAWLQSSSALQSDNKKHIYNGAYKATGLIPGIRIQIVGSNDLNANSVNTRSIDSFYVGHETVILNTDYKYVWFRLYVVENTTFDNITFCPMIYNTEYLDSTYEQFIKHTVTIPLGQTVYGGTLDVETGKLTIDTQRVELSSLNWAITQTANNIYFADDNLGEYRGIGKTIVNCDIYRVSDNVQNAATASNYPNGTICGTTSGNVHRLYIVDDRFQDATSLITALDGTYACYKLENPIITYITPYQISLLNGVNNIDSNASNINLSYQEREFATLGDLSNVNKVKFDGTIKVGSYGITKETLIVADENGYYNTIGLDTDFCVDYPILYSDTTYVANSFASDGIYSIINFDVTTMQNITLTVGKAVYIECSGISSSGVNVGSSCNLEINTSNIFTQMPSVNDYFYYYVGIATSNNNIVLTNDFKLYKNNNIGGLFNYLIQYIQSSGGADIATESMVSGGSSYCEEYLGSHNLNEVFLSPQDYELTFDNQLEKTIYWIEEDRFASDYTNRPYNNKDVAFTLTVRKLRNEDDNYFVQEFEDRDFSKYRRYYVSDAWTPWHLVEKKDTIIAPIYVATCPTAAATAAKLVTVSDDQDFILQTGAIVAIKFTYSNTATNVTLNVNSTGDKQIYYSDAVYTSTATQQTGLANRYIYYMYDGTYWVWINSDYESNTYDRVRMQMNIKAGSSAITAGNIIVAEEDGLYKHLKTGGAFDITQPILYAGSNISANATNNNTYVIMPLTVTTTQSLTLTANKTVYIKGTLNGATFTPISTTPLTQTRPTSADGYQYMVLGKAVSTTQLYLTQDHRIFEYTNGLFRLIG